MKEFSSIFLDSNPITNLELSKEGDYLMVSGTNGCLFLI